MDGGGDFPRGGFPRKSGKRRVPRAVVSPGYFPSGGPPDIWKGGGFPRRGIADGPRKTLAPTLNAGNPKHRTNKNATAGGKNEAGRDQHYRKPTPNAGNETTAAETTPDATTTKKATSATKTLSAARRF